MKILEASPGFGGPLNEQETKDFLAAGKLNIHLGTVDEKGDANIHPAWSFLIFRPTRYTLKRQSRERKRQVRKKEDVYFCMDEPNPPYKGARGKGTVKIHEDVKFNIPIAEKIMVKYLGNLEHPMAKTLLDFQKNGQSVVIEISPKYYSTWDYSKQ